MLQLSDAVNVIHLSHALNGMFANSCPKHSFNNGDLLFIYDLHCKRAELRARPLGDMKYELIELRIQSDHTPPTNWED